MDRVFHALADPTRRDIVERSVAGELSVSALARAYPISLTAVQKHVGVLERAGLVTKRRRGRETLVRTDIEAIRTAQRLLAEVEAMWRARIDRFAAVVAEDPLTGAPAGHPSAHRSPTRGGNPR